MTILDASGRDVGPSGDCPGCGSPKAKVRRETQFGGFWEDICTVCHTVVKSGRTVATVALPAGVGR